MKWGILATGTIAKKFASTVEQMGAEGEQLVAVGSRHLESAQTFAQQYGIPRCYDSYEALSADPEVEAIYIATPNTLHYENCKLCLEQGKHVLCEKPFTIDPEQAQQLYRLAEEKHLFLMEAFWIWLLPLYDRLREILAAGTIGELKQITCQYGFVASGARKDRKFDSGLGGGALLDIGMMVLAVTLHNIPEGMAVGVVYAGYLAGTAQITAAGALALSLGIAIQNFPEGAIISMPLRAEGMKKGRAFWGGVLSGIVEPIGAVLTILAAGIVVPALPYLLSFAAGAMLYVVGKS